MTAATLARAERQALSDLLTEVGADAPTLCEGWTTFDLAAHLVVRERRPDSGPGLVLPAFAGWTERVRSGAKHRGYDRLVEQVRNGPPVYSPFALPGADAAANTIEYFVHHEDVRRARAGWEPRSLSVDAEEELWRRGTRGARMAFRKVAAGVVLRRPDGTTHVAKPGTPAVTISGPPAELVLFSSGRRTHARVQVDGDPAALEALAAAQLGM
jgi:uncharacterized protein (TIGR03085 family)